MLFNPANGQESPTGIFRSSADVGNPKNMGSTVVLRLIPASGGEPKVLAWLYGGQGTINVPSWSPDSKKVAFVSISGK